MATSSSGDTRQTSGISGKVFLIAASVIIGLTGVAALTTLHRPQSTGNAAESYAANLIVSGIELAEATNGAGGKVTYIDGTVKNTGTKTVLAAFVRVTFPTEDGSPAQSQTVPLTLVRTRQPYVDLEPVSAEPLAPGAAHDFRLIFEGVPVGWNQKEPAIQIAGTEQR